MNGGIISKKHNYTEYRNSYVHLNILYTYKYKFMNSSYWLVQVTDKS